MTIAITREQLRKQIDALPDDVVEQIADYTFFLMTRRQIKPAYTEWDSDQWQSFTLEHFFREADDVTYSLDDAQEIYHPF